MFGIKYLMRKRAMGDVLWIEPVIRQLSCNNRKVIVYTKYNVLFENYPLKNVVFKDKINFVEKFFFRISLILNTHFLFINLDSSYEKSPQQHFLHAYQRRGGLNITIEYPKLYLSQTEMQKPYNLSKKYVVLHIESDSVRNYRKVYGVDWGAVASHLARNGLEVVQIGKNPDKIDGCRNVASNIRELISIINSCSLFIGIDSGPSHIATSLKKPALIFFGAINPNYRHFKELFNGAFLQQYCEYNGCYHSMATNSIYGPSCKLVGDEGIPKCSIYSTEFLIKMIDLHLNNNF